MKNKRRLIIQIAVIFAFILLGAAMMWIGRGHTIYLDNKTLTTEAGTEYSYFYRVEASYPNGEKIGKLAKKERGSATCMGQTFKFHVEITENKGDDPKSQDITLKLPYGIDGIIVNLPAYLAGEPESVWMSEFVAAPEEPSTEDENVTTDEFSVGDI